MGGERGMGNAPLFLESHAKIISCRNAAFFSCRPGHPVLVCRPMFDAMCHYRHNIINMPYSHNYRIVIIDIMAKKQSEENKEDKP